MTHIDIRIETNNAAFQAQGPNGEEYAPGHELARILREVADTIEERVPSELTLSDFNGNKVGTLTHENNDQASYDNEWLCTDCTMYVVNRDESGNSPHWDKESLLSEMEQFLFTPTGEQEDYATNQCGGCGTHLAGCWHEFAIEKNNN